MALIQRPVRKARHLWSALIFLFAVLFLGGLVWVQYVTIRAYRDQLAIAINELKGRVGSGLEEEKTRQETLKLRLENEQRSVFFQALLGTLSTSVGIIVAMSGVWIAFAQYMNSKERERMDMASKDLENLWQGIAMASNPQAQAASVAALQHFLSDDKAEYHDRVAAALALASRMKGRDKIVEETLRPIVEKAMRQITDSMRRVSWQGARIQGPDFSELDLSGFDFRDCEFVEANFRNSTLTGARFDAANLTRSCFEGANLCGANFEHADLADADFQRAQLQAADLRHIKLMNVNLTDANLQDTKLTLFKTDWRLARDWRSASFSAGVKEQLLARYGPHVQGPRVLMLLWEFIPKVSGGLWTASYHLLRNLRSRGANVSVAVPLARSDVSFFEFGNEIPLLPLGGDNPAAAGFTTYQDKPDQTAAAAASYDAYSSYGSDLTPLQVSNWFAAVAVQTVEDKKLNYDVIHAHDWQTFPAAKAVAELLKCPWVAHFHSTERDRRQEYPNSSIEQIEREACQFANAIVTPSEVTRARVMQLYSVPPDKMQAIPNCLSDDGSAIHVPPSTREAKRVVFTGRLSKQKGPDYFLEVARFVRTRLDRRDISFVMYGKGEMMSTLQSSSIISTQPELITPAPWPVPPTPKDSFQRLSLPIQINDIAPADYDEKHNLITPRNKKFGEQKDKLVEFVLSTGFVAQGSRHRKLYPSHPAGGRSPRRAFGPGTALPLRAWTGSRGDKSPRGHS